MASNRNIMVCVTGQRTCDRLIERGVDRSTQENELFVVHCVLTGQNFMNNPYESDAIEYLFTAAQIAGGQLNMLRADDVDDALCEFAQANSIGIIIMGASQEKDQSDSIIIRLQRRLPDVEFDIVS